MSDVASIEPVGEAWKLDPEYHKVSDFLGVNVYDRNDAEVAKKVYALKDWALEKGKGKTLNDALWQIRGLQKELGHNFIGKPLIVEMYKMMRLTQDRQISQPLKKAEKKQAPMGSIEAAIQKVVKKTITEAMKGVVK